MKRHTLFRWWYGSAYTLLGLILIVGLVVTPGDAIRQSLDKHQRIQWNIFVIVGCYALTFCFGSLIYFFRLWTNRTVLSAIPKNWIPIEKGEVQKKVRKMIVASLHRSAAIAWDARPRISQEPPVVVSEPEIKDPVAVSADEESKKEGHGLFHRKHTEENEHVVTIPPPRPVWDEISHNGWASPTSPDLPGLQYITVILELAHLIEARAVSLAPVDPQTEPPLPDIRAVELLQRPAAMGLREYIGQLSIIGVLKDPSQAAKFLAQYEYARFSGRPLTEQQFRDLMGHFAELLRNMDTVSPVVLTDLDIDTAESDIDDDGDDGASATPVTPRSRSLASIRSVSSHEGTVRTAPSRYTDTTPSKRAQEFSTAPATPRSKKRTISRSPSTFAQSRRPYAISASSSESMRSTSESSVIKLSRSNTEGDLPYTLTIPGAR
ncbi:related to thermatolerance membrane protein Dlt1 [Phialocephala subalpina]|uniref:Defect at low temperature protein 1 n=1 Tax=Phialocephala subalpina TaxID=576137 RepID=A0A1L7WZ46_9HELO|nr:related to thermatolerance membrane protein Dlt1 [Phialocephala subalpina]